MNEPIPPTPQKKGMPVLAWVGIGCGTILVIGVVCISLLVGFCKRTFEDISKNPEKSAAELVVKMNPNLEVLSRDDAKGTMTIRTKDGQEMTFSYKDVAQGKFSFKDSKGNVTQVGESDLSKVPEWVPRVAGVKSSGMVMQTENAGKVSGSFSVTSSESADAVEASFVAAAEKQNLARSSRNATMLNGTGSCTLVHEGGGKEVTCIITSKAGEDTLVVVAYKET